MLTLTHVPHRPQVWRTAESEAADTLTVQYEHKTKKNKDFSWKSENKDWSLYFFFLPSWRSGVEFCDFYSIKAVNKTTFVFCSFNIRKEHRWILLLSFKAGLPSLMVVLSPPCIKGTRIIYDRKFLLDCRNSPLARTPPCCLPQIPGVTVPATHSIGKLQDLKEEAEEEEKDLAGKQPSVTTHTCPL